MHRANGWAALIFGLLFLAYFLTQPSARFEADDAYDYAALVERGEFADLLNPYHPIYLPVVKTVYYVARVFGDTFDALMIFRILGAALAALTALLVYSIVSELASEKIALFAAGGLAASYGFWRYAAEAEVYAFAFAAGAFLVWIGLRARSAILVAASAVVAVLAHALNAGAVLILPYILRKRGWAWSRIATVGALGAVLGLATTYLIYRIAVTSDLMYQADASSYMGFYLGEGLGAVSSPKNVLLGIGVLGSVVFAPNFLMILPPSREVLVDLFSANAIGDEVIMGTTNPLWIGIAGAVVTVAAVGVAGYAIVGGAIQTVRGGIGEGRRLLLVVSLLWALGCFAVIVWTGGPTQPEVWLVFLVPFWMLLGSLIKEPDRASGFKLVPALLAVSTLIAGLLPIHVGENRQATLGRWLVEHLEPGDVLVTADSSGFARYVGYFSATDAVHIGYNGSQDDSVETIETLSQLLQTDADNMEIADLFASVYLLSGAHRTAGTGELYFTADVLDPPSWMRAARPGPSAALLDLADVGSGMFEPVTEDGWILRRIR